MPRLASPATTSEIISLSVPISGAFLLTATFLSGAGLAFLGAVLLGAVLLGAVLLGAVLLGTAFLGAALLEAVFLDFLLLVDVVFILGKLKDTLIDGGSPQLFFA